MKTTISQVGKHVDQEVKIGAWLANKRSSGKIAFLQLRDGTGFIQGVVVKAEVGEEVFATAKNVTQESSLYVTGTVRVDERSPSGYELTVTGIEMIHEAVDYPITPKEHGTEFLMDHRHLWLRSKRQHAIMKVRNEIIRSTYEFFNEQGFVKVDPPILTGSSAEGTTNLFHTKYFDEDAYLSQSGQLYMEAAAMALGKVFSFGPTFRAEKSKTRRHLIEFWMIEPEMAFYEIKDNMDLAEEFIKYLVKYALDNCADDLKFLNDMFDKELIERLQGVVETQFVRLPYTEGVEILMKSGQKFEYPVSWGTDLQSEHERYLVEKHFKKPVILTDYPKDIKAFYMKQNDDGRTVRAMDVLFPKIGEIIGGSQREESLEKLENRIKELNMGTESLWWYIDTRRFGSAPHSGFGLGFERLLLFVTGMANIRDVIPFPRSPKNAEF